ncbi:methyltransferase type 11 [Halostagnicola larsenii XH-48]|uniref:Methyltransferase type 11 n=1 Tax=Halostagnicola larsenii XH-48 TaxID=797299 RepID=W0JM54_9EURY|nr:class I SAM-dependent methyltransferase [Halostagnicola larsenii]AHF99775.1 methyltransferase type 11 [Halostagnicola larsenii XH-48]
MEPHRDGDQWDPDAYDGSHSFVSEYGEDLLEWLDPEPDERVLDVGCGTGQLTAKIAARGAEVIGIDQSEAMIDRARSSHSNCSFIRADATEFDPDEPFDAVFSNAALHWISEQDAVLESIRNALRSGGRFVAELGGADNVRMITYALETELRERGYEAAKPWYFPSIGEYAPRLEAHGFEVRSARMFDRPTELENGEEGLSNWLELFGEEFFESVPADERDAIVAAVEDELRPTLFRDGSWIADYRRLRFAAVALEA